MYEKERVDADYLNLEFFYVFIWKMNGPWSVPFSLLALKMTAYLFQVLTRDSLTVAVDAVVYYRVKNPTVAVTNVENFR